MLPGVKPLNNASAGLPPMVTVGVTSVRAKGCAGVVSPVTGGLSTGPSPFA
jgi:hypothetical protein